MLYFKLRLSNNKGDFFFQNDGIFSKFKHHKKENHLSLMIDLSTSTDI